MEFDSLPRLIRSQVDDRHVHLPSCRDYDVLIFEDHTAEALWGSGDGESTAIVSFDLLDPDVSWNLCGV